MNAITRLAAAVSLASLLPLALTSNVAVAADAPSKGTIEVLHWWTAGGERAGINVLQKLVEKDGYTWKDNGVAGGGGEAAMTVLKSRAVAGNPPGAAQIKGPSIQEWGALGFLTNLDDVAKANNWDKILAPQIADIMKYDGHYVAVPVNIHRVNWLWVNKPVFDKLGIKAPTTLDELYAVSDKLKAAGIIPLAHGGEAWQDSTVFEDLVLSILGPEGFHKAFVDKDEATLTGPKMVQAFEALKKLEGNYMDPDKSGRKWNDATGLVMTGKAGMQIMGDWAKAEWTAAGKKAGTDYECVPFPGTQGSFTYNIDSLAMFKLKDAGAIAAQQDLAKIALEPEFQTVFNQNKGSIPVRSDADVSKFDSCAQKSQADYKAAAAGAGLQPTMAHGMATSPAVEGAVFDVVTNFANDPKGDAKKAAEQLAKAVMQ